MIDPSICYGCPMSGQSRTQIDTVGSGKCELLMVGYSPAWTDAATRAPYTGNAYNYIWQLLSSIGVSFYVTTLYKCRSTGVDPHCIQQFYRELEYLNPKCILFMGEKTLQTLIPDAKFSEYRDYSHPFYNSKCLATYDPYYVTEDNEIVYNRFIDDLVYACRHATQYRTQPLYRSVSLTPIQFHNLVDMWLADPSIKYIGFDTESNGLDPLLDGSKITSFSVCADKKIGYNIYLYHPDMVDTITDQDRQSIIDDARRLLTSKDIVVHHAKHELRMIKVLWGFTPHITEDTMYMSYILYLSYPGISHGLKYLSGRFINLPPWEEPLYRFVDTFKKLKRHKIIDDQLISEVKESLRDIAPDLTSEEIIRMFTIIKDPDYFIKAENVPTNTDPYYWLVPASVMESYAGMDAIAPLLLMDKFKPTIESDEGLVRAYRMMVEGAESFANIELHGVRLVALDTWSQRYDVKLEQTLQELRQYKEVQDWESEHDSIFNPSSSKVLVDIMYDRMKFPVLECTDKGSPKTSEPVMIDLIKKFREEGGDDYRLNFLLTLRDYKKFSKIKSAYWEGLKDYIHEGKSFDGHTCTFYDIGGDIDSKGRCDIINPGYMLHGTDSVIAGTLVMTKSGEIPIEEMCIQQDYDNMEKGFYQIKDDVEVFDGDMWRVPLSFYYGGERECIRIKTESGNSLTGTPEHPVYTEDGWKPLRDLEIGSWVLVIESDVSYHTRVIDKTPAGRHKVFDLVMDVPD